MTSREQKLEEALRAFVANFGEMEDGDGNEAPELAMARAALSAPRAEAEPVAFLVHNFMVARQPVKAKGRFPEPDHYLYPASRKDDAEAIAKILRADCDPLYTSPIPAITDEAVERMTDWLRDNFMMSSFHKGTAREHIEKYAREALLAAFPSKGEGE